VVLGVFVEQVGGNHRLDDVLQNVGAKLIVADGLGVLGGNDNGIDALYLAGRGIFHGDLRFAIGTEVRAGAILADFGKLEAELVGQRNRQRHQFGGLIAGVAEHHSLIASAAGVDAHGDIARLLVDAGDYGAGVGVETVEGVVVADRLHDSADEVLKIDVGFGGDFAGDDDQAGAGHGLTGDAAGGILLQAGVKDGVGNLVGNLVGVAFGHGLRGKKNTILCWQSAVSSRTTASLCVLRRA